jgi:hypothetical protein
MCTVTYVPYKDGAIITSNRDEHTARGNTFSPETYVHYNKKITYPKDEKGNGTWIACNEMNHVAVLLNGAFKKHMHNPPYKHSRALIIPSILQSDHPGNALMHFDLKGVEPFTIILYYNNLLFEYRWDECELFKKELNIQQAYCWNSVTLYDELVENKNNNDLQELVSSGFIPHEMLQFHERKKYELQLPKNSQINNIKTISISQIVLSNKRSEFYYHDLLSPALSIETANK